MKKKPVVVVVLLLCLAGGIYWAYPRYFNRQTSAIQATGTIEATVVELTAKSPGTVRLLDIKEGDTVARGRLVAEITRSDLTAQRERDALAVLKAEQQLADLSSGAREQERDVLVAEVNIARTNYEKAAADLDRRQFLFEQGALSQEDLGQFKANLELTENQLLAAQARLDLLDAGSRPQAIAAARAEVERSKAVLKTTEAMLADLRVYTPISGVVISRNYEPGEFVQMGASLGTVADLSRLRIKVYVTTDELPSVKLGQQVQFTVSGDPVVFKGVVDWIASQGEFTPRTIQTKQERANVVYGVKIRIGNEGGRLKPGMPADVTFDRSQGR